MSSWQAPSMPVRISRLNWPQSKLARGRGHLHHGERLDQVGVEPQLDAGDVEVLERAGGLDAVVGVGGHGLLAEQVVLDACSRRWHVTSSFEAMREERLLSSSS